VIIIIIIFEIYSAGMIYKSQCKNNSAVQTVKKRRIKSLQDKRYVVSLCFKMFTKSTSLTSLG